MDGYSHHHPRLCCCNSLILNLLLLVQAHVVKEQWKGQSKIHEQEHRSKLVCE